MRQSAQIKGVTGPEQLDTVSGRLCCARVRLNVKEGTVADARIPPAARQPSARQHGETALVVKETAKPGLCQHARMLHCDLVFLASSIPNVSPLIRQVAPVPTASRSRPRVTSKAAWGLRTVPGTTGVVSICAIAVIEL